MKQLIELLRQVRNDYDNCRANQFDLAEAFETHVPQLLDRLEKLEAVFEAAKHVTDSPNSYNLLLTLASRVAELEDE